MNKQISFLNNLIDTSSIPFPQNKELRKNMISLYGKHIDVLHYRRNYQTVEYLSISNTSIKGLEELCFRRMPKLKELNISRNPNLTFLSSTTIKQINSNKTIREVTMDRDTYINSPLSIRFKKSIKLNLV